jgi:hypothetical protein
MGPLFPPLLARTTAFNDSLKSNGDAPAKRQPNAEGIKGGPAYEQHKRLYSQTMGAAVRNNIVRKIAQQNDENNVAKHESAKKQVGTSVLLGLTASSLLAEIATHFEKPVNKAASRAATGYMQKSIGMAGMAYYGAKFNEDPNPRTAALFLGYALFNAEGFARMWEGEKTHLPKTGIAATASAFMKMTAAYTMLGTFHYAADFSANAIEARHGTPQPKKEGFAKALWSISHSMTKKHIAAIQAVAALGMFANAGAKYHRYWSTKPAETKLQDDHIGEDAKFDQELDAFLSMLGTEHASEVEAAVERIFANAEEEMLMKKFVGMVQERAQLTQLTQSDPG